MYRPTKAKRREYHRRFVEKQPGGAKAYHRGRVLKRSYGMSVEAWEAMFEKQGRCCAICGSGDPRAPNWHTDHRGPKPCAPDAVRGIICLPCNLAIGAGDDAAYVREQKRAQYILIHLNEPATTRG